MSSKQGPWGRAVMQREREERGSESSQGAAYLIVVGRVRDGGGGEVEVAREQGLHNDAVRDVLAGGDAGPRRGGEASDLEPLGNKVLVLEGNLGGRAEA